MKTWLVASVALITLSGCGGSQDAVGENSAGSIKTTAVGEVVGNIATPTPTPTAASNAAMSNDTAADDAMTDDSENATTTH
jgi:hypothetical protein